MRVIWFFLLLSLSASSFAADYYWSSPFANGVQFPDVASACAAWSRYGGTFAIAASGKSATCYTVNGVGDSTVSVNRSGDGCPAGSSLSATTGGCVVDKPALADGQKCDDQSGSTGPGDPMIWQSSTSSCVNFTESDDVATCAYMGSIGGSGTAYSIQGNWDGGTPSAPPTFTQDGLSCEVATVSTTSCVTDVHGSVSCDVIGKLTGKASHKTDSVDAKDAACPGGVCTPIEQATSVTDKPCVYSGSGGSVSCTSEQETNKDGKQDCGTVNGVQTCIYAPPSSNGIKISTTVQTTDDPDGGKTSVKTDNATKTTCTGVNKCTTSTSTTTTTTKTNGSGTPTSTTSHCTGTCGSSGTGIGTPSGNGTGDSTGSGDGDGDSGAGLTDPEDGSFDGQSDDWDKKLEDSKKQFKDALDKLKEAFSPVGDIQLGGGGQLYCPPAVTVLNTSIDFCLDKYAGSLSWIASAIYALCAMVALMIVFG